MAYTNFNSAWGDFRDTYSTVKTYVANAISEAYNAYDGASDPVDLLHFGYLVSAVLQISKGMRDMGDFLEGSWGDSHFYSAIYWAHADQGWYDPPDEYELTAKKIVEAWIKDDFADRALTIGVIDRMRQILWDEPFNVTWSARPES